MSRTFRRRKDRKQQRSHGRNSYYWWRSAEYQHRRYLYEEKPTDDWKDDLVKVMETDCMLRDGPVKKNTKWQTRRARRADEKKSLNEVMKSHDYDDAEVPNRERYYKGFIWNWD